MDDIEITTVRPDAIAAIRVQDAYILSRAAMEDVMANLGDVAELEAQVRILGARLRRESQLADALYEQLYDKPRYGARERAEVSQDERLRRKAQADEPAVEGEDLSDVKPVKSVYFPGKGVSDA